MIIYTKEHHNIKKQDIALGQAIPGNTVWVDVVNVTQEEEQKLEQHFGLDIPRAEEVQNTFVSNRLYEKYNAIFMTIVLRSYSDNIFDLKDYDVTFIIIKDVLITIRDIETNLFTNILSNLEKKHITGENACFSLLLILLEHIMNDISSFLEVIGCHLDENSDNIISPPLADNNLSYKLLLKDISSIGNSISKVRESLVTVNRALAFLSQAELVNHHKIFLAHVKIILKEIGALGDHASFLSNKINFLLDATLGLINIEQNNIIKIFSVVSVIFTPPTLIASIYGMNFHLMPELAWKWGYAFAWLFMIISAWIPYKYFKKKKFFIKIKTYKNN